MSDAAFENDRARNDAAFARLLYLYLEGAPTNVELAEFESLLKSNQVYRALLVDASLQESLGPQLFGNEVEPAPISAIDINTKVPSQSSRWMSRVVGRDIAVAACVSLAVVTAVVFWMAVTYLPGVATNEDKPAIEPEDKGVAWLMAVHDVEWSDATEPLGTRLSAGQRIAIKRGLVQIQFQTGAEVVIEGPADFFVAGKGGIGRAESKLDDKHFSRNSQFSANSGFLARGSLVARCQTKSSKHFTIHTPNASAEDLGTEFGVVVNEQGAEEFYVLSGEVELIRDDGDGSVQRIRLTQDQGAFVAPGGRTIERKENLDATWLTALRSRIDQHREVLSKPSSVANTVLAHYGLEKTLSPDSVTQGLVASAIKMRQGGFSSMSPPEGGHSHFIYAEDVGNASPPTVADIKATWTLTPEAGMQVVLKPSNSVTWKVLTYSRGPFTFHSKLFVSSDPSFTTVLAESDVFTVVQHRNDRISPVVVAKLDAPLTSSGPLYFGMAFSSDESPNEKSNGRFDAVYINGKVSAVQQIDHEQ